METEAGINSRLGEQLINSSYIAVLVIDKMAKTLFVNSYFCDMFGYARDEIIDTSSNIFYADIDSSDTFKEKILTLQSEKNRKYLGFDYRVKRKDGSVFWVYLTVEPIDKEDAFLITMVDITLRKEIEHELYKKAQLLERFYDGIVTLDLDGRITEWNAGAQRILGYTPDEVIGEMSDVFALESDYEIKKRDFDELLKYGFFRSERNLKAKDQSVVSVELIGSLLKDRQNSPISMVIYFKNISDRKKIQTTLEETNYNLQQYIDVIDRLEIGIFVVDEDFTVRYMNNTMIKWFGNQTGKICYSSVAGIDEPCPYCKLHDVVLENKKVLYEPSTPDGQSFEIAATSIKNSDGTVSKMEVIRNVTDKKNYEKNLIKQKEELKYQATHDLLTNLPNRLLFEDRLELAIEKAKRKETTVALMFIDLDHFKEINDSFGHKTGDEVLKKVTQILQESIRQEDTIARLGGDEFTIILEDLSQAQDASLLAKKLLDNLSDPIKVENNEFYISSSIGISLYPNDGENVTDLLKYADAAMYKAKDEGRNNFQYYSNEMTELAFERVVMESSLRESLKNGDFVVYYQPQVNGKSDKVIGMEALVRWNHPNMGLVPPGKFIPLAESTGLIVELDRFVMREAMTQVASWYKQGLNPGKLAMNLSVKQLNRKDFIDVLKELISETKCKAQWIELEVTESQIMSDPDEAVKVLTRISDLGIELAVDDFGTGYSSLAYLKKLPIDKLKIDQTFVRDLPDDEEDAGITKAVIALAKSLKLKVIAEGVENIQQRDFIVENGCENIQGYFYSKPLPASQMQSILIKGFKA
jgi:diguanylate cyclase (GGDEF)-like protein/PAS domain S-box-containing protein